MLQNAFLIFTDRSPTSSSVVTCEYGVTFCGTNKQCVLGQGSHSKQGICTCYDGFSEDSEGECVQDKGDNADDDSINSNDDSSINRNPGETTKSSPDISIKNTEDTSKHLTTNVTSVNGSSPSSPQLPEVTKDSTGASTMAVVGSSPAPTPKKLTSPPGLCLL